MTASPTRYKLGGVGGEKSEVSGGTAIRRPGSCCTEALKLDIANQGL